MSRVTVRQPHLTPLAGCTPIIFPRIKLKELSCVTTTESIKGQIRGSRELSDLLPAASGSFTSSLDSENVGEGRIKIVGHHMSSSPQRSSLQWGLACLALLFSLFLR